MNTAQPPTVIEELSRLNKNVRDAEQTLLTLQRYQKRMPSYKPREIAREIARVEGLVTEATRERDAIEGMVARVGSKPPPPVRQARPTRSRE